jgi:hypothetical protein
MSDDNLWLLYQDKKSALGAEAHWEKLFPRQDSSYHPSGQVSGRGRNVLLTAGSAAGIAGSVLGGSAAVLACGYLTSVISLIAVWLYGSTIGSIVDVVSVFAPVIMLACLCLPTGLFGATAVRTVSKKVKNRNVRIATIVGAASSVTGAFILCRWILPSLASHLLGTLPGAPENVHLYALSAARWGLELAANGGVGFWAILSVCLANGLVGGSFAGGSVNTDKFCEACGEFMESRRLAFASLDNASNFAKEVKGGSLPSSLEYDLVAAEHGGSSVAVFQCGTCKAGYVDVRLEFLAKWPVPNKKDKYEKTRKRWLVASISVDGEEILKARL